MNQKQLAERLFNMWYQVKHFNEGLYPPGKIPSRRIFYVTNLKVIQTMFDRAGLVYENLRRVPNSVQIQVDISRDVAPHSPENLAFVDSNRFWSFTTDGFSRKGYWTMTFKVHAFTRAEAFRINILGQIPEEDQSGWLLVPGRSKL